MTQNLSANATLITRLQHLHSNCVGINLQKYLETFMQQHSQQYHALLMYVTGWDELDKDHFMNLKFNSTFCYP